jgi:ubiquinone/menaquinone biosynthesis C-methylase UbiE
VALSSPTQYRTDANLRARQRLWEHQRPTFDLVAWVLRISGIEAASAERVLDVGCGNGMYLRQLRTLGVEAVGCDVSFGMLVAARTATDSRQILVHSDAEALPFADSSFDINLAPHMLYHVPDRPRALAELRRVLRPGGRLVAVTNSAQHMRSLRALVEDAVQVATPGWTMEDPSVKAFSMENGEAQLRTAFEHVESIEATEAAPVVLTDARIAADYVASTEDHYQPETDRPWSDVVEDVRVAVQRQIDAVGSFQVQGRSGAFLCQ